MQYYEILTREPFSMDRIDKALSCVKLRKDWEEGVTGELSASKTLGLISVDSIGGHVKLVSYDAVVELVSAHVFHKEQIDSLLDGNASWSQRTFYANRFDRFKNEAYKISFENKPSDVHIECSY